MDTRLKALYATGLSSREIAVDMDCGLSRNAVIGRVNRLKLNRENGYENSHHIRNPRKHRPYQPRPKSLKAKPAFNCEEVLLRCAEVDPRHLSLGDLGQSECRWPYGDGPFTFCARATFQGEYCAEHFYLSIKHSESAIVPNLEAA